MEKKSLRQFALNIDAGRITVYDYIMRYLDELVARGCVEVKQVVKYRKVYILDEDCVLRTLAAHGVVFRKKIED